MLDIIIESVSNQVSLTRCHDTNNTTAPHNPYNNSLNDLNDILLASCSLTSKPNDRTHSDDNTLSTAATLNPTLDDGGITVGNDGSSNVQDNLCSYR